VPPVDQPRVAVVIPCFDDGGTLPEAVRSVQDQAEDVELVVVDDGSRDPATIEVIAGLERGGVRVVRQANAGLGRARMAGVRATTAPYVLALDADDILEPGAVARLADALDASPRTAAAWGWYQRFGDESTIQPTAPTLDAWQISYQNELPATALLRRTALEEAGGWELRGGYEDWDLWMALAERGWEGVGLDVVVYRYRRAGSRMLHDAASRHAEIYGTLLRRHPALLAARRRNWRTSSAPLALRLTLPLVERLPVSRQRKRLLAGVASHIAHRRGIGLLARRIRQQGIGTAPADAGGRRRQRSRREP
jgi:glycosyltransferase involved in cell wall biosynthesis